MKRPSPRVLNPRSIGLLLLAALFLSPYWIAYVPPLLWVQQASHLAPLLGFPLAIWALRRKERATATLLLVCTILLSIVPARRLFAEADSPSEATADAWKIVSWNAANDAVSGADVQHFLEQCDADFVALQELSAGVSHYLRTRLLERYPHRSLHGLGKNGIGLLSRYPIDEEELFRLEGEWPCLRAKVLTPQRDVTVFVTHPRALLAFLGAWRPASEDFATLGRLASESAPSVIVGDFNTTERTAPYRSLIDAGMIDAFRAHHQSFGFTFPVWRRYRRIPCPPIVRIDYLFHTPDLATSHCWIGEDAGSDHLPLFAEFD